MGMGMDVDIDFDQGEDEENVPMRGLEEIQPSTPSRNGNKRGSVGNFGRKSSILGSKQKASRNEADPYISPRQLRQRNRSVLGEIHMEPRVVIPVYEEREESEALNEEVSDERTHRGSPSSHSKRKSAQRRTAQRVSTPGQDPEDKEPIPGIERTPKKISPKERPCRKSILEQELDIKLPVDEEPRVSMEIQNIACTILQRKLKDAALEQNEDGEPTSAVETWPKRTKGISRKERPRKSILERELGIVLSTDEDESREPTRGIETPPKNISKSERARRNTLQRELGIVPLADEDSSDLHDENRNRRTSSTASDRIARQAEFEAAPINVFDRYLGESDVELPKPRRSSDAQVYVKKQGYKRLIGSLSRYPNSDDESVFDPSEARRNATPLRDGKGQFVRKASSSAVKPKSEGKRREAPRSSQNFPSVQSPESELPRNLSGSPVRSRQQRRLFNGKSEIPSSSAEEESGSEMMGSQQNIEPAANMGNNSSSSNNRSRLRPRNNHTIISYNARIPPFSPGSIISGGLDSGFTVPKSSLITSTSTEEQTKSPTTSFLDKIQLDTSRRYDPASLYSPAVSRIKRNKAADFFDLYNDYKPRSPPPSSDVSFQGEPESMTVCADTQKSIEELESMIICADTQLPVEEEPASVTVRGDGTQLPAEELDLMTALGITRFLGEESESSSLPWDNWLPIENEPASMTVRGDNSQLPVGEPSETATAPQPDAESLMKSTLDALFHPMSPPDSSSSSYHTALSHQEDFDLSQETKHEVASPLKRAKKEKAKRQPTKSPYFKQLPETPKKGKGGPETPRTSIPGKRSPGGIVSCIPFPTLSSSTFGLIQEKLAHDPFRLLIAVTFLNRTKGKQAIPVFYELVEKYPTPEALVSASKEDIVSIIRHLGLQNQRAETFQTYGKQWLEDPPTKDKCYPVKGYPKLDSGRDIERGEIVTDPDRHTEWEIGHMTQGPYAIDSWRIFCRDALREVANSWNGENAKEKIFQPEWMRVIPEDKELRAYLRWMWLKEGFHWDPFTGDKEVAQPELMEAAMKGKIAWDDLGGMRILRDDDREVNGKGKKEENVDTGKEVKGELDFDMGGVDGPPVERSLKWS